MFSDTTESTEKRNPHLPRLLLCTENKIKEGVTKPGPDLWQEWDLQELKL